MVGRRLNGRPPAPRRTLPWGIQLWQSDGLSANQGLTPAASQRSGDLSRRPYLLTTPTPSLGLGPSAPARGPPKIVTWLILPVVICLSQRLSHACLSISNYTVKLRMAH